MYAGLEHDIAILQLHKPVEEFTSYVSPICVNSQEKEDEVFTHCKLAGWGWADGNHHALSVHFLLGTSPRRLLRHLFLTRSLN